MVTAKDAQACLDALRVQVCSHCPERPNGGPPCSGQGKRCGIELHLESLIDSVRQVQSNQIAPYLKNNQWICDYCPFHGADCCPCPMKSLAVLVVEAIESVPEAPARQVVEEYLAGRLVGHKLPLVMVEPGAGDEQLEPFLLFLQQHDVRVPEEAERLLACFCCYEDARDLQKELRRRGHDSVIRSIGACAAD